MFNILFCLKRSQFFVTKTGSQIKYLILHTSICIINFKKHRLFQSNARMADSAQENNNNAHKTDTTNCPSDVLNRSSQPLCRNDTTNTPKSNTPCSKNDMLKDITNSTSSQTSNQASKFHSLYDTKEEIGRGMSSVVRRCVNMNLFLLRQFDIFNKMTIAFFVNCFCYQLNFALCKVSVSCAKAYYF